MKIYCLSLSFLAMICACHQTKKADSTVKASTKIDTQKVAANKVKQTFRDISGYYEEVDEGQTEDLNEGCNIFVTIKKIKTGYSYHLAQDTIQYNGKVSLTQNADKTMGIVFEGIKYAEYEGDISNKKDGDDSPELTPPVGVGGQLEADTITIQNYGNSMNYYVQLGGCGVKFLRLVKKHQ